MIRVQNIDTHLRKCDDLKLIHILSFKPRGTCQPDDLLSVFLLPFPGGHFFQRSSLSPRSLVCESEFSTLEPSLDMYDENKT